MRLRTTIVGCRARPRASVRAGHGGGRVTVEGDGFGGRQIVEQEAGSVPGSGERLVPRLPEVPEESGMSAPTGAVTRSGAGGRSGSALRTVVALGVAALLVLLILRDRTAVSAGWQAVSNSHVSWLLFAGGLTCLLWAAGTVTQLAALAHRVPVLRTFAVQIAADFANHFVPSGAGGVAVNLRFLRRQGLSRTSALTAQAVNHAAGVLVHLSLMVVAAVVAPRLRRGRPHHGPSPRAVVGNGVRQIGDGLRHWWSSLGTTWAITLTVVVGLALAAAAVGLLRLWLRIRAAAARGAFRRRWEQLRRNLRAERANLRLVLRNPRKGALLWAGSVTIPVLHVLILTCVLRAVGSGLDVPEVAAVYLVTVAASQLVPSPGGFGTLDVGLTGGLVSVGVPDTVAIAAVMAYRIVTVWGPLVPGACVAFVLWRRRVI